MYSIDKKRFSALVCSRPALCAKLVNPNPETIATALYQNHKSLNYIKNEWLTKEALEAFIPKVGLGYCHRLDKIITAFRLDVREAVNLKAVNVLVKSKPEAVIYFPQASLYTWKLAVTDNNLSWLEFKDIPEAYRIVPDILTEISRKVEIPEELWTPDLVWKCLNKNPDSIELIPEKFLSLEHLKAVFQKPGFDTNRVLPETYWDQTVAELAIKSSEHNLYIIPVKYRTKALCLEAVKKDCYDVSCVPPEVLDAEIMLEVLSKTDSVPVMDRFKTLGFMLEIAAHDNPILLMTNYLKTYVNTTPDYHNQKPSVNITEDMWCTLLEARADYLKFIPKSEQTKAMIDSVLKSATNLDKIADTINLNLITKDNAMLFMGTTNPMLQSCIEKKLGRGKKNLKPEELVASSDQVLIDLTDSEYRNL
jgi:hypothetical protein